MLHATAGHFGGKCHHPRQFNIKLSCSAKSFFITLINIHGRTPAISLPGLAFDKIGGVPEVLVSKIGHSPQNNLYVLVRTRYI